jgi:hypothetical protein
VRTAYSAGPEGAFGWFAGCAQAMRGGAAAGYSGADTPVPGFDDGFSTSCNNFVS